MMKQEVIRRMEATAQALQREMAAAGVVVRIIVSETAQGCEIRLENKDDAAGKRK